jgi:hypothetical protein
MLRRWASVFVVVLFGALSAASAQIWRLKPALKPSDLLDGRLTVRVPAQAKAYALERSIMAAPEAASETTRIVIDSGPQRLVILAYELFARTGQGGQEFEQGVRKDCARLPMKVMVESWPLAAPLRAFVYFPVTPTLDKEANLLMGVYAAQADGTVQHVAFFFSRSTRLEYDNTRVLAKSIARTIAPGPRGLNSAAGEREFSAYSAKNAIFATVPDGYVVTLQPGPDFIVHHVRKIVPLGETAESLGVYLGDYPSSNRQGFKEAGTAILFGKQAKWYEKEDPQNGEKAFFTSAIIPLGEPNPQGERVMPSFADVFLSAGDRAGIEELKKIAATLRIGAAKAREKK